MNYLTQLESESIFILREVAAQLRKPVILFSGGKDSACIVRLTQKAFWPAKFPFAIMHIDTAHNFPETIKFRDEFIASVGEKLIVRNVEDSIRQGRVSESPSGSRNSLQSVTLMDAIHEFQFDGVIGGARRDEEKARAKERVFSVRDEFGQWDPRNQRPELWSLYNGKTMAGGHLRVFPLSNWTEMDVWEYIRHEKIPLPSVYFSHKRKCIRKKNGSLLAACDFVKPGPQDKVEDLVVRCRTVGDMTCTGLIESTANDLESIMAEVLSAKTTERGLRMDDKVSESAMEDRKRQGYF